MVYTPEEVEEARERAMRSREEQGIPEPTAAQLAPIADAVNALLEAEGYFQVDEEAN